jgi:hypothetical protein
MMDSREYINKLFKIVKSDSILIIDMKGQLRRIYCPIPAEILVPVGKRSAGLIVFVEAVKMTTELKDVFTIFGKAYYISYFRVVIDQ